MMGLMFTRAGGPFPPPLDFAALGLPFDRGKSLFLMKRVSPCEFLPTHTSPRLSGHSHQPAPAFPKQSSVPPTVEVTSSMLELVSGEAAVE